MSIEAVELACESRFRDLFETPESVPVDYGQAGFLRPSTQWVRFAILGGSDASIEIDATSYQTTGLISVQCFSPENATKRDAARLYDKVASVFRDAFFGDVHTFSPVRTVLGITGGWYQTNCTTEFEILTRTA